MAPIPAVRQKRSKVAKPFGGWARWPVYLVVSALILPQPCLRHDARLGRCIDDA
jgi:hypothetical protein